MLLSSPEELLLHISFVTFLNNFMFNGHEYGCDHHQGWIYGCGAKFKRFSTFNWICIAWHGTQKTWYGTAQLRSAYENFSRAFLSFSLCQLDLWMLWMWTLWKLCFISPLWASGWNFIRRCDVAQRSSYSIFGFWGFFCHIPIYILYIVYRLSLEANWKTIKSRLFAIRVNKQQKAFGKHFVTIKTSVTREITDVWIEISGKLIWNCE